MEVLINPPRSSWEFLVQRPVMDPSELEQRVRKILEAVKVAGDSALLDFTERFDGIRPASLPIHIENPQAIASQLSPSLREAIGVAKSNIEAFHRTQQEPIQKVETMPGVYCWRKSLPIDAVGLYIPGGTAPLFSTILMLAVPAKIAGCPKVVLCTPPNKEGHIHPAILYTAHILGIEEVFPIGGAQAVAAMAYGTESVPKVDKIFGPGNQYVTLAKQLVSQEGTAIDMPAGPSEVAVVADETVPANFVAADLLSQAEHGVDSQVFFVTNSESYVGEVQMEIAKQLHHLPRAAFAEKALANSKAIVLDSEADQIDLINAYAPEHLILSLGRWEEFSEGIRNAGSVFLGPYTPESVGDYASGTNHTLPTNGYARAYSGVSLDSFIKKITFQHLTAQGIRRLGPVVEHMAKGEELDAHFQAVRVRLEELNNPKE
ncbi:MAG: histidinol dehydrogenase [Bacteroidota bacterium]